MYNNLYFKNKYIPSGTFQEAERLITKYNFENLSLLRHLRSFLTTSSSAIQIFC